MFIMTKAPSPDSERLRSLLDAHRLEIDALLNEYQARNPRLFGSVARGEAHADSYLDLLVELDPQDGNILWRAAGLMEGLRELLGMRVDLFCPELMKRKVCESALRDAIAL